MSETPLRYECQEYPIPVAGMTLRLLGPKYPHDINYEPRILERTEADGFKPYWAQAWPGAVMLAEHVIRHVEPGPGPALELGAGLGIAGVALSMAGHRVIVTDYDEDALAFVRANAKLNGVSLADVRLLDWRTPPSEQYALIVGSEIVYEERSHEPIARLLARCLQPGGRAYISDSNRPSSNVFPDVLRTAGLTCDAVPARARAIPMFDAIDGRVLDGRVFRIRRTQE